MSVLRILLSAAVVTLVTMIALVIYLGWSISTYSGGISNDKADAAIVLGAAAWHDQPSPVFKERINHAIWLYRKKLIKKIIFTGAPDSRNEAPESFIARNYAVSRKVQPSDILTETTSRTTFENIHYASEIGEKHGLKSFLIVSDPLHMKRAMLIAGDCKIEAYQSPTPTTRYKSWCNKLQFLGREIYFYSTYSLYRYAKL